MSKIISRNSNSVTIANFYEDYLLKKYNMNPSYQRRSLWSEEKKAFFIDSLLKNLPIPPIFLKRIIDDESGKTSYDVIDGKQRLTSIVEFIKNQFPVSSEYEDPFYDSEIDGKYFEEFGSQFGAEYKKNFWRYALPVEYVDAEDEKSIDNIFDRLNRNGEPLNGQELRQATFHKTMLLKTIVELSEHKFWEARLENVDRLRMEELSFVSELVFSIIENQVFTSTDKIIDDFYHRYASDLNVDWNDVTNKFCVITDFMYDLGIDYKSNKVDGVSHLFGIWLFCKHCIDNSINVADVKQKINQFFNIYKDLYRSDVSEKFLLEYKQSMQARTKFKGQREKRVAALINYCCD